MPPDDDTLRATLGLSAIAGGTLLGLYRISTMLVAGQPVHVRDVLTAAFNLLCSILAGALVAYFVGPAVSALIPMEGLREPHALGFGIGALAWELFPLAIRTASAFAARKAGGLGPGGLDQ